jgi:putative FmdB family regulatory protein
MRQYKCESCGHLFDCIEKVDDLPKTVCPNCGDKTLRRVIFPTPHVFKGRLASRAFGGKDKMQDGAMPKHPSGG